MRNILPFLASLALGTSVCAQGVITRIGPDGTHFYYNGELDSAVADANLTIEMDTILLGGGTYVVPNTDLIIEQPIVLVGTGPDIDSTAAYYGRTVVDGNDIFLRDGADGSEFHGLAITSNIYLGEFDLASTNVDDLLFSRCEIRNLMLGVSANGTTLAENIVIDNCVMTSNNAWELKSSQNLLIANSVIKSFNAPANGTLVEHCLVMDWGLQNGPAGVTFRNNIFLRNLNSAASINGASTYVNNLHVGAGDNFTVSYGSGVSHNDIGALHWLADAFVGLPQNNASYTTFQYTGPADYHVIGDHQGTADDGTDPGPYGGNGWKEGSIPFNPHWRQLTTPGNTVNGVLGPVTINASAQTN